MTKEPDIIAVDDKGRPTVLVEVRARALDLAKALPQAAAIAVEHHLPVAYLILVGPQFITLYKRSVAGSFDHPATSLPTEEVLAEYDATYASRKVFDTYLESLVEAWLRDLAYHWHSDTPPGSSDAAVREMAASLAGGTTLREPRLAG